MLKIYGISQNQFQQRETKDRHIGVILLGVILLPFKFDYTLVTGILYASSRGRNCVTVSNFVGIDQTAADVWRFFDFSRWRPPPSWMFKFL